MKSNINLEVFTEKDFGLLIDWIYSPELNYLWGGPSFRYPLTQRQITRHCRQAEVSPFLFTVDGQPAGFVELYYVATRHYRICRVLIAPPYRGRGMSKQMITLLTEKAQKDFDCQLLSLAVFGHNTPARRCYESLGFHVTVVETGTRSYQGASWDLVRMEKELTQP